jgi:hypothetical protein
MKIDFKILALFSLITIFLSGCNVKGEGSYQPPVIPLVVSIDTNGAISFSVAAKISAPTPLGTFAVGVVVDPVKKYNVPNVLTIRVDGKEDRFYNLEGNDFDLKFESGFYENIRMQKTGKNLLLEIKKKQASHTQTTDLNRKTESPPKDLDSPNPNVTIKLYSDSTLGKMGKFRVIVLAGGQPIDHDFVYIAKAEKDVVGNWAQKTNGVGLSVGYEGNASNERVEEPGSYMIWFYETRGNWGVNWKNSDINKQMLPINIFEGKITEVKFLLSLFKVGLVRNGKAATGESITIYFPSKDAAGNLAKGATIAGSLTNNLGIAAFNLPSGDYLIQWNDVASRCQYFNVSIPVGGPLIQKVFELNNPGKCIN